MHGIFSVLENGLPASDKTSREIMVPNDGLKPPTSGLKVRCSFSELIGLDFM